MDAKVDMVGCRKKVECRILDRFIICPTRNYKFPE